MELLIYSLIIGSLKQSLGIMCSQCDSDTNPYCLERPPASQNCTLCGEFDEVTYECMRYIEVEYCITEKRYINETLVRITRDCSPAPMSTSCEFIEQFEDTVKICFRTCKTDGCNSANIGRSSNVMIICLSLIVTLSNLLKCGIFQSTFI